MIVISDTTTVHYLVLIGAQDVLPALFGRVLIPEAVAAELARAAAPEAVRLFIRHPPGWLEVRAPAALERVMDFVRIPMRGYGKEAVPDRCHG